MELISIIAAVLGLFAGLATVLKSFFDKFSIIKKDNQIIVRDYLSAEKYILEGIKASKHRIFLAGSTLPKLFMRTRSQIIYALKDAANRKIMIKVLLLNPNIKNLETDIETSLEVKETMHILKNLAMNFREFENIEIKIYNEPSPLFIFLADGLLCYSSREAPGLYIINKNYESELFRNYNNYFESRWQESQKLSI